MYLYRVLLCCCLHFLDSEHTTKDSDFQVDEEQELAGFEVKKRKLDDAAGQVQRRTSTRRTGKAAAVGGGSSAGVTTTLRTKRSASRGPNPSNKGKDNLQGPSDVEKEKEITENLGTCHIDTWHRLRKENPYRFHTRQYTGVDKMFWTETQ
jgi:hypothetical protein